MLKKLWRFTRSAMQIYAVDWVIGWVLAGITVALYHIYRPAVYGWWVFVFAGTCAFQAHLVRTYLAGIKKPESQRTGFEKYAVELSHSMHLAARVGTIVVGWIRSKLSKLIGRDLRAVDEGIEKTGVLRSALYGWVLGAFLLMSYRYSRQGREYARFRRDSAVAILVFGLRISTIWVLAPIGIISVW